MEVEVTPLGAVPLRKVLRSKPSPGLHLHLKLGGRGEGTREFLKMVLNYQGGECWQTGEGTVEWVGFMSR